MPDAFISFKPMHLEPNCRPDRYDLVVTNFFLDCLSTEQAVGLVETVTARRRGALWLISDFSTAALGLAGC